MIKDSFLYFLDLIFSLAAQALNLIGDMLNFNPASYIDGMPSEVINVLGLLGIGSCMTIVVTSLLIRLVLQLIPFVRLGS